MRSIAIGVAIGCALAAVPATALAAKPKFGVTISMSSAKADVGKAVTIKGKVSGPGAASKKVVLEGRVGSGAWKTVGTTKTSRTSAYTFKPTIKTAGAQSFRVVAPKSSQRSAGTSAAKSLVGWRWLYLSQQNHEYDLQGSTPYVSVGTFKPVSGKTMDRSFLLAPYGPVDPSRAGVDSAVSPGTCTRARAHISLLYLNSDTGYFNSFGLKPNQSGVAISPSASLDVDAPIDPDTEFVGFTISAFANTRPYVVVGQPRVYCSVNALPSISLT